MKRVILIVLDSVGAGELPDAERYGDQGANTLGNTVAATGLRLPNMEGLGLGYIEQAKLPGNPQATGLSGRLAERSPGKDTTTGHWEMAGVTLSQAFPTYPRGFPKEVIQAFETAIGRGSLGNMPASGTQIIQELGEEHLRTGFPIVYTSADSVFQIATHEGIVPNSQLYQWCQIARDILRGEHAVGRVIARPFTGDRAGSFARTAARRDFSLQPPANTILDDLKAAGEEVIGIGKIEDIFAHRGLTQADHVAGNAACIRATVDWMKKDFSGLLFVNLVDFDMIHGHRRDAENYAKALSQFDQALPKIIAGMGEEDLLILTADHGCDPTFRGSDHTREYAPLLVYKKGLLRHRHLGDRATFADIAATIAEYFGLKQRYGATSFLPALEELMP